MQARIAAHVAAMASAQPARPSLPIPATATTRLAVARGGASGTGATLPNDQGQLNGRGAHAVRPHAGPSVNFSEAAV